MVKIFVIGSIFDDEGVFETDCFVSFVPIEDSIANTLSVFFGDGLVDVPCDGFDGFTYCGGGVFFDEVESLDEFGGTIGLFEFCDVKIVGGEESDAGVGVSRGVTGFFAVPEVVADC